MVWYVEDLERRVWRLLNKEVEDLKLLRRGVLNYGFGIHAGPPIVFGYRDVLEVGNEHVAIVFEHLGALAQDLVKHSIRVDKRRDCI